MYTVLSLILLVSEMLKIPRAKVDTYFLKKFAFVTKIFWHKMPLENVQGQQKTFQNKLQYVNSYKYKFSYYLEYSAKLCPSYLDAFPTISSL